MTAAELTTPRDDPAEADVATAGYQAYDFRGASRFGRDQIRSLQIAHEVFARTVASSLGATLRGLVQVEVMGLEQVTFDDYVRSAPSPSVLGVIACEPLPAPVVSDLDVGLALSIVDRMVGGGGATYLGRRPTELEIHLLREVFEGVTEALQRALRPYIEVTPNLLGIEHNPQLVQIAGPSDLAVVLTFRITIAQGAHTEGVLTLCYPVSALEPILAQLSTDRHPSGDDAAEEPPLAPLLAETSVEMRVRLGDAWLPTSQLAALAPGDVVRLGIDPDDQVTADVEGHVVACGHVGRSRRRLALLVRESCADRRRSPFRFPSTPPSGDASV